jgi:glutathione synthase/RimK-type ligase-like ATP-grasp enzyme
MNGCEVKGCKYWSGERCEYDSVNCIFNEQEMDDEIYMNTKPKNTKHHILMCEESYKLLQQEIAELRQAKEKAEAEVASAKKLIDRILYARKEGIIRINRGSNFMSHILAEAVEGWFWEAKKFVEEKDGEG